MTLIEIIEDINIRLPHKFTDENVVSFLNKTLNDIQRVAGKSDVFGFDVVKGIGMYPLPTYVGAENIKSVTIGGREIWQRGSVGEIKSGAVFFVEPYGYISFEPVPSKTVQVRIVYNGVVPFLTLQEVKDLNTDLTDNEAKDEWEQQTANVYDEYSELLPLGAMITIANAMEDISLANNYRIEYNSQKRQAMQNKYLKRGKYPVTKIVR